MRSLDGSGDQIGGAVEMTDTVFSRRLSVKQKFVLNSKYCGQSPNALNISSNGGPSAFKVRGPLEHAQASDPQRRADRPTCRLDAGKTNAAILEGGLAVSPHIG
jgi:hypothetical protein